jgi:hypothetical protein
MIMFTKANNAPHLFYVYLRKTPQAHGYSLLFYTAV